VLSFAFGAPMSAPFLFGLLAAEMWLVSVVSAGIVLTLVGRARGGVTTPGSGGPQHIHAEARSRLGGAGVFLGFAVAITIALQLEFVPLDPALPLLISALPVYVVGLCEDITHRVSPRHRLLAAVFSAALAIVFAQGVVTRLDVAFVDGWLTYLPFAVPLTCFMVAGACNAFNIIDGTHGLAGGSGLLMFVGVALVAWYVGDTPVLAQAAAMTGGLVGFLLWNYPKGKVFLGDAGAYFTGFMYAQLSIQLVARNANVSAWFVVALAAYPIVETLFSMYRRKIVRRSEAMQPDLRHLHSLLYIYFLRAAQQSPPVERRQRPAASAYQGRERREPQRRANARVAPRLWLHGALCFVVALIFYDNTSALIGFTLIYGIVYRIYYANVERLGGHTTGDASFARFSIVKMILRAAKHGWKSMARGRGRPLAPDLDGDEPLIQ
jgi:UDP-N-acetylmuramyl pentapeptide phosphotransferase/UDP-N-acetylglucosamine-1-phosphate transferase